jgi:hypothetical protein
MTTLSSRLTFIAYLAALIPVCSAGIYAQQPTAPNSQISAETTIPLAELLEPAELVPMLHASGTDHPLILQVGSHVLYAEAHIAGSQYAGAGGGQGRPSVAARTGQNPEEGSVPRHLLRMLSLGPVSEHSAGISGVARARFLSG